MSGIEFDKGSVYDVEQGKVLSQVEVGCKENEITKTPKALKMEITEKVVTGDAIHTQRDLSSQILAGLGNCVFPVKENQPHLYRNIQSLFAPEYPKPGFGKIATDFQTAKIINKGRGHVETRIITTSEMLNLHTTWPGLAQVYRLEWQFEWQRNGRCIRTSFQVEYSVSSLTREEVSS